MHILFLSDNFPPEVNAPASRTFEHCRAWVKSGHRVTVITCAPNFPSGKIFAGYKNRLFHSECQDGIEVIRVWSYIAANEGFLKRTVDYMSFLPSAVFASLAVQSPDIVVGTSPQFFTVCAAYIVSRMKSIPFVFELRDIWPESIKAVGAMRDSLLIRMLEKIEMFLYRKADLIVSVTESFKKILTERGIDPRKIAVVTNGADLSRFRRRSKDEDLIRRFGLEDSFVAGYAGTHGMAHHLETLLEAAEIAQAKGASIKFVLLGNGACKNRLVNLSKQKKLHDVIFIDSVPKDQVARFWSIFDVSIIHLRKSALFESVIPSKLFECMAMGIPVVHGVVGESAKIVETRGTGLTFEPESARQLYARLIEMMDDRSRYDEFVQRSLSSANEFDRSVLASRMLELLDGLKSRARIRKTCPD